jgi:phage host-nuclease inhibitor protein Gam
MNYDVSKSNWLNPNVEYLIDNNIVEYDIQNAGLSIIKEFELLSEADISLLENLDKIERHIAIGKIQRENKEFSRMLTDKFAEIRAVFISANNLSDNNIISVKKDAIFTVGKCNKVKFNKIEFIPKNKYSSYIRFVENMNIEIYYNPSDMSIKGIGDISINKHRLYMMEFIRMILSKLESKDSSIKRFMMNMINNYKNMKLEDEYYIEFNNMSREFNPIYNFKKVLIPLIKIILREV